MIDCVGVCSWSLQAADAHELAGKVAATGLRSIQIALDPIRTGALSMAELCRHLPQAGLEIRSGMMAMAGEDYGTLESIRLTGGVVPDTTWETNRAAAYANAALARALGIPLVTFHAGFIPESADDPQRAVLVERLRELSDIFGEADVHVALETGQESAETLAGLLQELPDVAVNFDPANLILYDRDDPVDALEQLLPRVVQVHIKDAVRTTRPGTWGQEVPVGEGDVDWPRFLALLKHAPQLVDLIIEREAGAQRVEDVRRAHALLGRNDAA